MTFEELISGFGKKIGVELTTEDETCVINVDDMVVTFLNLPDCGKLAIHAEIGDPPPHGLEQLLSSMLEANHLFVGTAGATISRDRETGKFQLCRQESLDVLDEEAFAAMVESFVNTLGIWRKALADYRPSSAASEARPAPAEEEGEEVVEGDLGFGTGFLRV